MSITLILSFFVLLGISVSSVLSQVDPSIIGDGGSGAIWTTRGDCGDATQDENQYGPEEDVYINGNNFPVGVTYNWQITGQPGSCDSSTIVASGSFITDASGAFCFHAYTINQDDCGTYTVDLDSKNDNYQVTCVDHDGDGYDVGPYPGCPAGNDCDDSDPNVNPGADEICDDTIDNDCDGDVDCDDSDCTGDPACCIPDCSGLECGDDGCGGSCGDCPPDYYCDAGICVLEDCSTFNELECYAHFYECDWCPECNPSTQWNGLDTGVCRDLGECPQYFCEHEPLMCGAECDSNNDCGPIEQCAADEYQTRTTYCDQGDCACEFSGWQTEQNCDDWDGWFADSDTRWLVDPENECIEYEQELELYYDYYCCLDNIDSPCCWNITGDRWVNTSNTRPREPGTPCDDGLFCTVEDICDDGICGGVARDCGDGLDCTEDSCDELSDECVNNPNDAL